MLIDNFGRIHNYLRISLTDNCNFRCAYCMPHEDIDVTPYDKLMSADEIYHIASVFKSLGVDKIRLTGGEPLMRRDFLQIIEKLKELDCALHITTNGVLLHKYEHLLKEGIFKGINLSLDTLDKEKFLLLTKRDAFDVVWKNIEMCIRLGIHLKINVVLLKGINDSEVNDFITLTEKYPIHIRFIEFMPFDDNSWSAEKVITNDIVLQGILEKYNVQHLSNQPNDTDTKFKVINAPGTFAFISTLSNAFCHNCNRMRITADGKMKNCLFGKEEIDLLTALRDGNEIESLIRQSVATKHAQLGGQFDNYKEISNNNIENRSMIKIGG